MNNVAKALVFLAILAVIPDVVFAQNENWDGYYHQGDFAFEVGLGFGYHVRSYSVSVVPAAEWTMADWKIGRSVPLAFGVTAKGFVELVPGSGLAFGSGGFATFHMGLKGLDTAEFIQKLDVYAGLGLGLLAIPWESPAFGIAIPLYGGLAYYFKDDMAAYLEGGGWCAWNVPGYGGVVLGLRWKK